MYSKAVNTLNKRWIMKCMVIIILIFLLVLFIMCEVRRSKFSLTVSNYSIKSDKISDTIRIVQLSDLHNSVFDNDNERLIETVKNQSPDIILLTGDMLNSNTEDLDIATDLIKEISLIAPVYCSYGNHEQQYEKNYKVDISSSFEASGATMLEKEYVDLVVKGQKIRIGGIGGYCLPEKYGSESIKEECNFLKKFQNTDAYTILMAHMPVCWIKNDGINEWNIDCVFSGHAHGGEVILPIVGGVYAPDMGWFPGRLQGLYYSDNHTKVLVLSRGLGTKEVVPRFNNVPEVVRVDISSQ